MNFAIGDKVELNGETYKIVGTVKRSWLLEKGGKQYKATSKMMNRIKADNEMFGVRKKRKRTKRSSTYWMEKRLAFNRIFDKTARLPETEDELMDALEKLTSELSPENLSCDGEASRTHINGKLRAIRGEWREIEKKLGRKVSEGEVEDRWLKRWREENENRKRG